MPFLSVNRNGLRQIRAEPDTQQMITFVSIGHHFISLYVDHDDSLMAVDLDDVVRFPVSHLPPMLSPAKASRN